MKRILSFFFIISVLSFISSSLHASKRLEISGRQSCSLTGIVVDNFARPLPKVMIQLYTVSDSAYVTGTLTNDKGQFTLSSLPLKRYRIRLSYLGMKTCERIVQLTAKTKSHSVGTIRLEPDAVQLHETVVTAEAAQVVMKGDTAIFSTSAYKLPEGAVVEDLIKRLPGVYIDGDGKITVNGKNVSKILVDGKEFFGTSSDIALKNLTADIVDHVKTYEKESDMAKATGVKDGKEKQVLDISIKPEMKRGWFGQADVAQGNHARYAHRGMLNRFRGNDQASLIYNKNNVRSTSIGGSSQNIGRTPSGKREGQNLGVNFQHSRKHLDTNGSLRVEDNDMTNASRTSAESYYSTGTRYSRSQSSRFNSSKAVNGAFDVHWAPDSLTTIMVFPKFRIGKQDDFSTSHNIHSDAEFKSFDWKDMHTRFEPAEIFATDTTQLLYQAYGTNQSKRNDSNYSMNGSVVRRSAKRKGRSFTFSLYTTLSNSDDELMPENHTHYYRSSIQQDLTQIQRQTNDNTNYMYTTNIGYNEPVGKNKYVRFSYAYRRSRNKQEKHVYDMAQTEELEIDSLGNSYTTIYNDHDFNVAFNSQTRALFYTIGMMVQSRRVHTQYKTSDGDVVQSQHVVNYAPVFQLRHKISNKTRWNLNYNGRTQQPSMNMLSPITDYSNPTYIREGNPNLKPAYSQYIQLQYVTYSPKKRRSFTASIIGSTTSNGFSYRRVYDEETGITRTRPMNINGQWTMSTNYTLTIPLAKKHWTSTWNGRSMYSAMPSYQMIDLKSSKSTTKNLDLLQRVQMNYRDQSVEIGVAGNVQYSKSENDRLTSTRTETFEYNGNLNGLYRFPFGLSLAVDGSVINRNGFGSQEDGTDMVLNGQVSYSMLKGKKLTFSLQAMDILGQQPTVKRSVYSTGERIVHYDALTSYVLFHISYRFKTNH